MSKYKTGKELIQKLEIRDLELFEQVKGGLQPLDKFGRPIPPPDISAKLKELERLQTELNRIPEPNWLSLEEMKKWGSTPPSWVFGVFEEQERARPRRKKLSREIDILKEEMKNVTDINSWANYELPGDDKSAERVIDLLLNAFFKLDDVSMKASPLHATEPIDNTALTNNDDFISNLKVEYSSDNSIILTPKGKQPKEYSCQAMGFKSTAKTWTMLIEILQMEDPQYHIGIYPKGKHPDKVKKYNSTMQIINAFNKKFVAFLNAECSAQIPGKSKVLKNQKGLDRDGTYRPIFRVVRPTNERKEITKKMSREQWQKEIDILAEKKRREEDPNKEARLLVQMGPYITKGNREGWLSKIQAEKYLSPNDEDCSPGDLLADAEPLPGNI